MTDTPALAPPAAGSGHCRAIAGAVLERFVAVLEAEAQRHGNALGLEQIRAIARAFAAGNPSLAALYSQSWTECSHAREQSLHDRERQDPFDRLLAKSFAHLFPVRPGDDGSPPDQAVLSRRVLPGFAMAVTMMIGPLLHDQCQRKAQALVARHALAEDGINWDAVHHDPEARLLVDDVLMVMAHYFQPFEKRRNWFLAVTNSHLDAAEPEDADPLWLLDEARFTRLMQALFADLAARLAADGGAALRARYSEHGIQAVEELLDRLKE